MILSAKENELTWLENISLQDIPQNLPNGIKIHQQGNLIGIEAQGVVGSLPLLNGDTLHIKPKVGNINFLRLLFRCQGDQKNLLEEYEGFVQYFLDSENHVDFLVAKNLLVAADEIIRRSPLQGRVARRIYSSYLQGKIDTVSTSLNIARFHDEPVVAYVKRKTIDIPENRMITEAVLRAWSIVQEQNKTDILGRIKDRWTQRFPRSRNIAEDIDFVERGFASGRYGGSRDYYRKTLMLAQVILGSQGLGLHNAEIVQGSALLLNTADVFEKYIRNTIANSHLDSGYVVSKGGAGSLSLYTDGSFILEPDVYISKSGRPVLIADAKYKKPDSGDHYQMLVYLRAHGIRSGLLISPSFEGTDVKIKEYATSDKIIVREAYLPMQDLATTEDFLASVVSRFG